MSGAFFSVEIDQVAQVGDRLTEITDALDAAVKAATDLSAVSGTNPGFTSVDAALGCATAWLDEVDRLAGRVDTARGHVAACVTSYRDTDTSVRDSFTAIDSGLGG